MREVVVRNFVVGEKRPLTVICGPCVIESEDFTLQAASKLQEIFSRTPFQFIFKASYDKANRTSIHSFRGPGIDQGLKILSKIQQEFDLPILTDIHTTEEALIAGQICDVVQIPAFLCRQTDLIIAAGQTPAAVNVKKGQFVSPWDMKNVVEKLVACGKQNILLTDRGTSFGYNNLVSDMRAIPIMQSFGFPVCFDATHSAQLPGGLGTASGGQREFIPTLAKAAIAAGANALFIEAHPDPARAKSDAGTVMPYDALKTLLSQVERLYEAVHSCSVPSR
jgi:2-dehydro-3-deoxyphosphooctonate aldolase (KDO 8-P synthase)